MKKLLLLSTITCLLIVSCSQNNSGKITLKTESFKLSINNEGSINKFIDTNTGINYLSEDTISPLMSIQVDGEMLMPEEANYDKNTEIISLKYQGNIDAGIHVSKKDSHLVFELVSISEKSGIELIVWGPYTTTINKVIGETIGVVQGEEYSIGIQALNPKTLGGYPWADNDCMPQLDIFESGDYSDLSEKGKRYVLYRVEAAKPDKFGSTLQAYCRNRDKKRVIENWNHDYYVAPPFDDGGIIGSKIAIFGCQVDKTLETIGKIEIAEGLPHPMIDGEWGKTSRTASAAYMIMGFNEKNIEKAIDYTKKAGLRYLYQGGPFKTWGHFELQDQFPNGWDGLKICVEKAEKEGVMLGAHFLSNFITTNDPYVTPIPDKRLARVGSSKITEDINNYQTEIAIESPEFFDQFRNNNLKTVVINNELIRYLKVSEKEPWKLLDCQRGAYKTIATSHSTGETIGKLADHGYKVFLSNSELTIEMAKRMAELYNYSGLRQISFDGLEGNRSTGMGNYGEILMTNTWYENLSDNIKSHYIADASRTTHFFWHMYTRMNWGEPWYADFRESQTEYRLKNQKYFKRNLMPGMLGWFSMRNNTSIEDIEWMLARSAAFNAGYAFVTGFDVLENNGNSEKILELIGLWEKARMADIFNENQKKRMEDINNEFHLKSIGDKNWELYQIFSYKFKHEKKVRQPGEPLNSSFNFNNPADEQVMSFIITAKESEVSDIKIEIDNYKEIKIPVRLKAEESIKYTGGDTAIIYSPSWQKIKEININPTDFKLAKGEHSLTFDCSFSDNGIVKLEIRVSGTAEIIEN
ncbi:hypothetical protein ACFLSI_01615 [Bacteroidota bacterium]